MEIDALIVGQGLAGSLLAWEWQELGGSVVVVDDGHRRTSKLLPLPSQQASRQTLANDQSIYFHLQ